MFTKGIGNVGCSMIPARIFEINQSNFSFSIGSLLLILEDIEGLSVHMGQDDLSNKLESLCLDPR